MKKFIDNLSEKRKYQLQLCASIIPIKWQQGKTYWRWRRFLQDVKSWDTAQIKQWQLERLKHIVRYAYENTEGYHELYNSAGVKPDDIRELDDIKRLPFISKEIIRDDIELFSVKSRSRIPTRTQGSTGTPLRFYIDRRLYSLERAFIHSAWDRIGWKLDYGSAIIRGTFVGTEVQPYLYNSYRRELKLSPCFLTDESLAVYMDAIKKYKPRVVQAFPAALMHLCDLLITQERVGEISFDFVLLGSENIFNHHLNKIQKVFPKAKIYGWFGHSEMTIMAPWCGESQIYHPIPFYGYTEIIGIDNKEVQVDQEGELVGTGWHNYNTPLIRYRTADYAVKGTYNCPECGCESISMKQILGRSHDAIVTRKWCLIPMAVINTIRAGFDGIRQFQFYQDKPGEVIFKYITPEPLPEKRQVMLRNELCEMLGNEVKVELIKVDKIESVRSRKHRIIDQRLDFDRREMVNSENSTVIENPQMERTT